MAAIYWSDVLSMPGTAKLQAVPDATQFYILAYVNSIAIPQSLDGEAGATTRLARMCLAAHMGTTLPAFGMVSSQSGGGLSQSFAVPPPTADGLSMTTFGRQYLGFVNRSMAKFPIVG